MSGYDPADPVTSRGVRQVPEGGYVSLFNEREFDGAEIGVVREFFKTHPDELEATGATIVGLVEAAESGFLGPARILQYEFKPDLDRYLTELGDAAPYGSLAELVESGDNSSELESCVVDGEILDVDVEVLEQNLGYLRRLDWRQ